MQCVCKRDFIIVADRQVSALANRTMLVLEVKGQDDQEQQTKREFLVEWVRAINGHGGLGTWAADSVAAFVTRL